MAYRYSVGKFYPFAIKSSLSTEDEKRAINDFISTLNNNFTYRMSYGMPTISKGELSLEDDTSGLSAGTYRLLISTVPGTSSFNYVYRIGTIAIKSHNLIDGKNIYGFSLHFYTYPLISGANLEGWQERNDATIFDVKESRYYFSLVNIIQDQHQVELFWDSKSTYDNLISQKYSDDSIHQDKISIKLDENASWPTWVRDGHGGDVPRLKCKEISSNSFAVNGQSLLYVGWLNGNDEVYSANNIKVSQHTEGSEEEKQTKIEFKAEFSKSTESINFQEKISLRPDTVSYHWQENTLFFSLADNEHIDILDIPYRVDYNVSLVKTPGAFSSLSGETSGTTGPDTPDIEISCDSHFSDHGQLTFTLNLTGMGNDPCKRCCSCEIEEKKYKTVIKFTAEETLKDVAAIDPEDTEYEWQENDLILMLAEGEKVTVSNLPAGAKYEINVESEDPCDENEYLIDNGSGTAEDTAEGTVGEDSEGNPQEETEVNIEAQTGETVEQYLDRLRQKGYEALAESLKLENVEFTLQDERVKLGDLVTVDMPEFDFKAVVRVTGVKLKSQNNQTTRTISVGTPLKILRKPRI